jgi:hypothetical protein
MIKLLRDRNGATLPDDDAGREYLRELLLPISLGPRADIKMRHAIEVWMPWMGKDEARGLLDEINQMPMWQRKPKARALGERLNVIYSDRERLRLRTILPCDVSDAGMVLIRKKKRREREKKRRELKGAKSRATSITKTKPWLALGISRASWYRQQRETNTCPINLIESSHEVVSPEKRLVSKKVVAELEPTIKSESTSKAEKPD